MDRSISLDTRRAIPAAAANRSIGNGSTATAVNDEETKEEGGKEEDRSQEAECDVGLELGALIFASNAVPVPDAAAVHRTDKICEQTKGNHEQSEEDEVHRPVNKAGGKWEEEEQREEDADSGDNLSVDESLLRPC